MTAQVAAVTETDWESTITIDGSYLGPVDIVRKKDYRLVWSAEGSTLLEMGSANLVTSTGDIVKSTWSSTIIPEKEFVRFPDAGELIDITISPFRIDGNSMSYDWEGTVSEPSNDTPQNH